MTKIQFISQKQVVLIKVFFDGAKGEIPVSAYTCLYSFTASKHGHPFIGFKS